MQIVQVASTHCGSKPCPFHCRGVNLPWTWGTFAGLHFCQVSGLELDAIELFHRTLEVIDDPREGRQRSL